MPERQAGVSLLHQRAFGAGVIAGMAVSLGQIGADVAVLGEAEPLHDGSILCFRLSAALSRRVRR